MRKFFVYASICVEANTDEEAEQKVRDVLNICTEPDNDLWGFMIESSEPEQIYCACCGHECYEDLEPTIIFSDTTNGNRYCSDCSIDYEEIGDGRIVLREQE